MLVHRVVEPRDAVERDEPDAQRQDVVAVERLLEEVVVGAAVDMTVQPLVEIDQAALVESRRPVELREQPLGLPEVIRRPALGGEARSSALEHHAHLRQRGEVAHLDARDEHAAPGMHLDEVLPRELAQRLAHRCAADLEPRHQRPLVDERTGRQLERHDQLADPVVGAIREGARLTGFRLQEWKRHRQVCLLGARQLIYQHASGGESMSTFPSAARAVVIGCGIVGNSLAYHLAELGWSDLVLIDKGPLPNPGGSTGHASNFIFLVDHSKEMTQLTLESVRQYRELDVYTECGGIEVARTEERMEELRRRMASAKSWGIDSARLVTPAEIKELVPYIDESILLGGFHSPTVSVVDSLRAGTLMRDAAVDAGALTVFANTEVLGIDVEHGRVRGIRTSRGDVAAETIVVACGVWSPLLAELAGAHIPLVPMVHQMIDVGPVPRFEGTSKSIEFPIVRDMDVFMYERQDGTGLEIGSYAHRSIQHEPEE